MKIIAKNIEVADNYDCKYTEEPHYCCPFLKKVHDKQYCSLFSLDWESVQGGKLKKCMEACKEAQK